MKKYLILFSFPCLLLIPMLFVYQKSLFGDPKCSSLERGCGGESYKKRSTINCETLLAHLNTTIPVLLIDVFVLKELDENDCITNPAEPVKINDSFELTVVPKKELKVFIDIFLMYQGIENGTVTHHWKEYGKLWYIDHLTSKYSWNSSGKNVKKNGKWTKDEMKEVYKVFKGK
uniref:Lipoprotein n=1 Tax=Caenorhabditis tropicalis TaxID=1561998 RepID=A0A1I7UJQ1_9PELO